MAEIFPFLYERHDTLIARLLGTHYERPAFSTWTDCRIALLPKDPEDGDGQAVEIWEQRAPARFLTIRALAGVNSVKEPILAWELGFGSCNDEVERTAFMLAKLVTEGMASLHRGTEHSAQYVERTPKSEDQR